MISVLVPRRRCAQFSLSTAFLLTTFVGFGLRMIVVPAESRRRAVAAIKELGGEVTYAAPSERRWWSFFPNLLKSWLPADYLVDVHYVSLADSKVTDAGLQELQPLTKLRRLNLYSTQITGPGLAHLQDLRELKWLNLNRTNITDDGLKNIQSLIGLETLYLDGSRVSDAGMSSVGELPRLKELWLNHTEISDAGLEPLQNLKALDVLLVGGTKVSEMGIVRLRRILRGCEITSYCSTSR